MNKLSKLGISSDRDLQGRDMSTRPAKLMYAMAKSGVEAAPRYYAPWLCAAAEPGLERVTFFTDLFAGRWVGGWVVFFGPMAAGSVGDVAEGGLRLVLLLLLLLLLMMMMMMNSMGPGYGSVKRQHSVVFNQECSVTFGPYVLHSEHLPQTHTVGFCRVNALFRNVGALPWWAMPLWSF
jgi:hypothetical protein